MTENTRERIQINDEEIDLGIMELSIKLRDRLEEKGCGTLASRHEIYGMLAEEMQELLDAITGNKLVARVMEALTAGELTENTQKLLDSVGAYSNQGQDAIAAELLDVAVGALFGYICVKKGSTDW